MTSKFNFLWFLLVVFHTYPALAQHTDVINSNRPGESQSAFAVGKTVFQIESGVYGIREKHNLSRYEANGFGTNLVLRYGAFLEELEFIADMNYRVDYYLSPLVKDTRTGFQTSVLGAKYLIYDPNKDYEEKINIYSWRANQKFRWRQLIPAVAVFAGAHFNFNSPYTFPEDPSVSPKVMLMTQNLLGTKWVLVTNIFADKVTTDFPSFGYVITLTRSFHERLSFFGEHKGIKSDFYADGIFTLGAAWLAGENLQLDASISKNYKDTPSLLYGGVGVSWRFDINYQDILIPLKTDKEKKAEKEAKEKKPKSEKRKRKDAIENENNL